MSNDSLTRDEVLALWGFAEIQSLRFSHQYMRWGIKAEFIEKLRNSVFENLTPVEKSELVRGVSCYRSPLIARYNIDDRSKYHFIEMQSDILSNINLMSSFYLKTPSTIEQFLSNTPSENFNQEYRDIITAAEAILMAKPSGTYNGFPIIAFDSYSKKEVLIDGYGRIVSKILKYNKDKIIEPVKMILCTP